MTTLVANPTLDWEEAGVADIEIDIENLITEDDQSVDHMSNVMLLVRTFVCLN